jgi:sugar phosphate isomerase/epimerase
MKHPTPFRLGSTSYVIPADILPNVRHVGPLVDDVELVIFEVDETNNLPTPEVIAELIELAEEYDLTYTVHLPLDLKLASSDDVWLNPSMDKARRVIACTRPLDPWAYVVHLDGVDVMDSPTPAVLKRWRDQATRSLELVGREAGDLSLLTVENLENYDPAAFEPIFDRLPVSACVDVGHFFKNEQDPFDFLDAHLPRTRIIHAHGSSEGRDHRGLDLIEESVWIKLVRRLLDAPYEGVLTLEVFTERHFMPGRDLILRLVEQEAGR